jgi:hypothetical protein
MAIKLHKLVLILFFTLLGYNGLYAQYTKIAGVVTDSITNEPVPFVNVYLMGTSVGATTGFDGRFEIKTKAKSDTLLVSYIGYESQKFHIKYGAYQSFNIKLKSSNIELSAVEIHPGENPAHILLRKVIAHKEQNTTKRLESYDCKVYNKIQMDMNNVTEDFKNKRVFKSFEFIFDNIDTSTINGKIYLPLMLTESNSNFYHRSNPEINKEVVKAARASGVQNESMAQFLGSMYQNIYIYDNYIRAFNKNFTSPIADFGLRTYRYYLIDSATVDGHWCYQMMFKPKRKQEATFMGEMWIADTTFAVKRVSMKIDKVNLNYVNAMSINQEFKLVDGKYWVLYRDNFVVDFNVVEKSKKVTGFFAHKTSVYTDYVINKPHPDEFYRSATTVEVTEDAWNRPESYWDTSRTEALNDEEAGIYKMIDTIAEIPRFQTYYDIISMIVTGYYGTDYVDIGPFYKLYSFNAVEGNRFRIGGRTSNKVSTWFRLYGHLAYGTKDERFKYGLGVVLIQNKNPRRALTLYYKNDMEQLGASINAISNDNILSSILRTTPNDKLTMVEEYKLAYEYEWFNGFSNTLTFRHRRVSPLLGSSFELFPDGPGQPDLQSRITSSEIELKTHFAYRETFFFDKFNRKSLGTKYPTINMWYAYGIPDFLNSDFEYHRLQIAMKQRFNVGVLGRSEYILSWGKIWGTLPYNLLEVHPGNETFVYDPYAYNGISYYEFISDEFFSAAYTHHFQGLFFNHIPLLRKLKWREVIYGKMLMGSLRDENREFSTFPANSHELYHPYYEAGVGIENIFKVIRIDFGWRLNYLEYAATNPFRVRFTLQLDF